MPIHHVHVSPELEEFVQAQVANGRFGSVDEVLTAALERLAEEDATAEFLASPEVEAAIQEGLDDLAAGRYITLEGEDELKAFMEEIFGTFTDARNG